MLKPTEYRLWESGIKCLKEKYVFEIYFSNIHLMMGVNKNMFFLVEDMPIFVTY